MTDESAKILEGLALRHHERVIAAYPNLPMMHKVWKPLAEGEGLRFAVEAFAAEGDAAVKSGVHGYRAKNLPGLYLAVSAVPSSDPSKAPGFFKGGYLTFCNQLLNESGYLQGGVSLAHWIICTEPGGKPSVHLTFISDKFLDGQGTVNIFAQDMMTLAERKEMGMA